MFSSASTISQPSLQSNIGTAYIETINRPYITNGTYQINDKYFNFVYVNKIYNDREYIYDIYSDNKYFGQSELEIEERIIERKSIPIKNNFLDYYE